MANSNKNAQLDAIIELSKGKRVVADGPLSAIYTETLNKLYAKEVDPETGYALESQVNDEITRSTWLQAANTVENPDFSAEGEEVGMLYGVKKDNVRVSDVINVSNVLSEMSRGQKDQSSIIVDAKVDQPNDGTPATVEQEVSQFDFEPALRDIAAYHAVRVYPSLEAFLTTARKGSKDV